MRTPDSILSSRGCKAETLTLSSDHATVLLTTEGDFDTKERSLLKLTVVPFHQEVFQASDKDNTDKVLSFLASYDFQLTSESGAEYSYYNAVPKRKFNKFLSRLLPVGRLANTATPMGDFKVELISPASDRQIQRAVPPPSVVMIEETPELYEKVTKPYIQSIIDSGSLSWIKHVVTAKKERERLLLDSEDYVLNIDTKWRSHPDANNVPRAEWYEHKSVVDLYCLAIVKDGSIASLRDLRVQHLPILNSMFQECPAAIEETYGVQRDQLRIFVHYQPQFYHFHVHITRLENEIGCQVERGHLLSDIIQNLEMDGDYYEKRTISFKLPINDKLYCRMKEMQEMKMSS